MTSEFWQAFDPPGTWATEGPFTDFYPATMPDGRQLRLPLRVLPGDGSRGVAGLIANQASFAVLDGLTDALAAIIAPLAPDLVVGVPTLGLPLAEGVARRLGHARMVPLSTSGKFWYRDDLAVPLASITTPERRKTLFLDPRMLPVIEEARRVVVVDDVISSGQSTAATLSLLGKAGVSPLMVGVVMEQGQSWRAMLASCDPAWPGLIRGVFRSPRLARTESGWQPIAWGSDPQ